MTREVYRPIGGAYSVHRVVWFVWAWRLHNGSDLHGMAFGKRGAKSAARWALRRRDRSVEATAGAREAH